MCEENNSKGRVGDILFVYAETPMHPGTGAGLGTVDLPVQRERITEFPIFQASTIKGVMRFNAVQQNTCEEKVTIVFGPPTERASEHAGAITFTDGRLLLFPVRSLKGVFTWVTSLSVLSRLRRDLEIIGIKDTLPPLNEKVMEALESGKALVTEKCGCIVGEERRLILEEYAFEVEENENLAKIGEWLKEKAFPKDECFKWWRDKVERDLVILPEDDFRDFVVTATEVVARIRLDYTKKTVKREKGGGALWYEEYLPAETLMYSVVIAQKPRPGNKDMKLETAEEVLDFVRGLKIDRIQLGGDETVGKGLCKIRWGSDCNGR